MQDHCQVAASPTHIPPSLLWFGAIDMLVVSGDVPMMPESPIDFQSSLPGWFMGAWQVLPRREACQEASSLSRIFDVLDRPPRQAALVHDPVQAAPRDAELSRGDGRLHAGLE